MDTDPALSELKKLREGRGLSAGRLADCPNLLSATGTSDPLEAFQTIVAVLGRLGDGERLKALKLDFGLELTELLERLPTGRECDFLGDRRNGYAEIVGRDVKTLGRWSDRAVRELRAQLINDRFDGHLIVAAGVQNRRLNGIELMRYELTDTELRSGDTTTYLNPLKDSGLPLILFGFPRDWRPASIRFVVAFLGEDYPSRVWALVADSVLDVGFGHERTELMITEGMARCRIENPRRDQLYGVWWEWERATPRT